jgi:hypothetical protein
MMYFLKSFWLQIQNNCTNFPLVGLAVATTHFTHMVEAIGATALSTKTLSPLNPLGKSILAKV